VTHFNEAVLNPTWLELEGQVVGSGDVDGDGLPDDWELFYLNTLTHSAAADPDGDGATNLTELRAGTDPTSNASSLRIVSMNREPSGRVALHFSHAASRRYTVEFTENFGAWNALTISSVRPVTHTANWTDESAGAVKRLYRVRSELSNP
jgi:hypothetical protein